MENPGEQVQSASNHLQRRMRERRFLPLFTVVQFPNQDCKALTGDNGTCMSQYECKASGGISSGICANNFGVCCLFMVTCGQTSNRNGSYFVNKNYPAPNDETGSCQVTLRKAHPDVCQYRIDFIQFSLMGPEQVNHLCNSDQFLVSGSSPVPPICGKNTGSHIYVDAGDLGLPVMLTIITSGASFSRNWKMRISQIPCNSNMKAEDGCLQYYSGVSGQIKSFNYEPNSGLQLSNQDYTMCIRSERNFCSIQYSACPDLGNVKPFRISFHSNNVESPNDMGNRGFCIEYVQQPCTNNLVQYVNGNNNF
ncbi:hypothetical protein LSTR_LSTR003887 [Laodelphax striatellus]|uniref:CUB domain-containing protein n=1 Tax=Laodelphax striatellus TaxID=195883 RepID=A0A482XET9_LAOST|nr:hypothetical protein LSTR_LSTR003887 [Laodelphax striatellus]